MNTIQSHQHHKKHNVDDEVKIVGVDKFNESEDKISSNQSERKAPIDKKYTN